MSTYRSLLPIETHTPSVTALSFDPVSDTLWTGNGAGGIVAFYGTSGNRGVTFPVGGELSVKKIIAGDQYVRAAGSAGTGFGCWSKGGVNKWYYHTPPQTTSTFSNTISASPHIAVSSNAPEVLLVNSSTGTVVRTTPVPSVITHLVSSHSLLIGGSADGFLRTYDVRAGNLGDHSTASVKSHEKGVAGLDVSGNNIYTIGWGSNRNSRPVLDPFVKMYDIRKLQPFAPIPFSSGPCFINVLPRKHSSIIITSDLGLVSIVDTQNPSSVGEFYQVDVTTYITSAAVSSTGVYLAHGDAEGNVHLMTAADDEADVPLNGFDGQPIEWADPPEPLPEINWTDNTPLNSVGMPYYNSLLLSSWTPQFLPSNLYYPPAAKIPPQVLNTMKINEFVGYATLPKELQGRRNVAVTGPKGGQARFKSGKARRERLEPETPTAEAQDIPRAYRRVEIEYSKFGVEDFDFSFFNKTEFSGLESHIMNSYTNAIVQTMHYVEPINRLAKSHITTNCVHEHCLFCELGFVNRMLSDARGTNCQASNFCRAVGALALEKNLINIIDYGRPGTDYAHMIQTFHRFLLEQLSSEGNSFPHNPQVVPIQTPLSVEKRPMAAAPITQLLGVDAKNIIVCNSCKAVREKENMTHIVDMVYPRRVGAQNTDQQSDFAAILRSSLIREMTHKATCQTCKQFAAFESRRSIPSRDLPPILAINASVYNEDNLRYWMDTRHGTFLKATVEVRGQVDGVDDAEAVVYELRSMIVQISPREKTAAPHLVAIIKVPDAEYHNEPSSPWLVFNDFVVTSVTERDALGFPGTWKVPAVLYLERIDIRSKLDYSKLPMQMDLSILQADIQHFRNKRDPTAIHHEPLGPDELPTPGMLVSIDAEFVSMQQEENEFRSDGTKKVLRPARLSLARVSVLRGDGPKQGVPFIDDHIHTSDIVVDYLTEFSGIMLGDLDPSVSRHTLVPLKVAYKKLRLLVDLGCIFIGHGLSKDFRIINLFVPPEQVIDTVDLYFIKSRQRRLSLRYLSWAVLKQHIQTENHDSIEDARSALLLFKAYQEFEDQGIFDEKLEEIYRIGKEYNWRPPPLPGAQPQSQPQPQHTQPQPQLPPQMQPFVNPMHYMNPFDILHASGHGNVLQQQAPRFMSDFHMMGASPPPNAFGGRRTMSPRANSPANQQNWRRTQR